MSILMMNEANMNTEQNIPGALMLSSDISENEETCDFSHEKKKQKRKSSCPAIRDDCVKEARTNEEITKGILNSASIVSHLERTQRMKKRKRQNEKDESTNKTIDIKPLIMDSEKIQCDLCDVKMDSLEKYHAHKLTHFKDDTPECPVCKKIFSSVTNMRYHLATHTEEKRFQCKYCEKKFNWRSQLITHEHIHTGEGLYYCPLCGKPCLTKWLLTRHIEVHARGDATSAEKQSKDKKCQDLSTNLSLYEENDSCDSSLDSSNCFKCVDCCESFNTKELMAAHLLIHLTGQTHHCKTCGKVFKKLAMLRRHIMNNFACAKASQKENLTSNLNSASFGTFTNSSTNEKIPKLDSMLVPKVILPKDFKLSFPLKAQDNMHNSNNKDEFDPTALNSIFFAKVNDAVHKKRNISTFLKSEKNLDQDENINAYSQISHDTSFHTMSKANQDESITEEILSKHISVETDDSMNSVQNEFHNKCDVDIFDLSKQFAILKKSFKFSSNAMQLKCNEMENVCEDDNPMIPNVHKILLQVHSYHQEQMTALHSQMSQLSQQIESFRHQSLDMIKTLTLRLLDFEKYKPNESHQSKLFIVKE